MEKVFKNRPNFLGSEVGLLTKTITVPANFATYVMENNRKVVKAGTIFTSPYYGLLYEDVDITDGAKEGSLMIRGSYIDAKLPASAVSYVTYFKEQGLYAFAEGSVTRPDFGTAGLTALSTPSVTVASADISWASISGAQVYNVFDANKAKITSTTATGYTATATGTYYINAGADNVNYKSSDLAVATVSTLS